eukprot:GDKJ01018977.1.p1 GENE.GDKJ01018977.1~~GDKJ01018977.1.p1  ORF type:complete len:328 (+),score=53.10 GDKJ01018977.1:33-1016(+)
MNFVDLRNTFLVLIILQNCIHALLMFYSKNSDDPPYSSSTAVMLSEVLKFSIAMFFFIRERRSNNEMVCPISIFNSIMQPSIKDIYLPSILYSFHNNLQFVAAGYLDPALMQVSAQSRLLMTAGFSVFMLNRKVTPQQWLALTVLYIGVVVAQASEASVASKSPASVTWGCLLMLLAAACSGLGAVCMEKALKASTATFWQRNVQVCFISIFPSIILAVIDALSGSMSNSSSTGTVGSFFNSMFQGLTFVVWGAIISHALGGFVVAGTLRFADAVAKGVATSLAVVAVGFTSWGVLGNQLGFTFWIGSLMVVGASIAYVFNSPKNHL